MRVRLSPELLTTVLVAVAVAVAVGVWLLVRGGKAKAKAGKPTRNTELVSRVINNLDWDVRTCDVGATILTRLATEVRSAGTLSCASASRDALVGGAVTSVANSLAGANNVTKRQVGKDLRLLVDETGARLCESGALLAGASLARGLLEARDETCSPETGTLISLYRRV